MTRALTDGGSRAVRWAASGGVVGPVLFTAVVLLGGVLYDGYSHSTQKISELGGEGARYAVLQNVNFIVLGVLVIGFSWALARVLGRPYLGPISVAFFGLSSAIANGLLPCDIGCRGATTVGLLHNVTGVAGFVAAIVGMLVLARRWRDDRGWESRVSFTRAMALVAVAGLAVFIANEATGIQRVPGVLQRIFVGALLLWIAVIAVRLRREHDRGDQM